MQVLIRAALHHLHGHRGVDAIVVAVGTDEGVGSLVEVRRQTIGTRRLVLRLPAARGRGHRMVGQQDRIDDLEDALVEQQVLRELLAAREQCTHGTPAMAKKVAAAGLLPLQSRRDFRHQQIRHLRSEETLHQGDAVVPDLRGDAGGWIIGLESAD